MTPQRSHIRALLCTGLLLSACGGAGEVAPPTRTAPRETLCRLEDPAAHVSLLTTRAGGAATPAPGLAPVRLDMTGDGEPELAFVAETATDRWLALVGCQDGAAALLGAFRMPGRVGTIALEPTIVTRGPAHELKTTLRATDGSSSQEFWAYFGFDGADLGQLFAWFVERVPPQGPASRAAITLRDEDGDGVNEIRVLEEMLDGDGARARRASPEAPAPRIDATRNLRFRYDTAQRAFLPADAPPAERTATE